MERDRHDVIKQYWCFYPHFPSTDLLKALRSFRGTVFVSDSTELVGRRAEGEALFERLPALSNDLGLLAEEYDSHERHMLGNFPQALTHMALINTAHLLSIPPQQVKHASDKGERPAAMNRVNLETS